MGDGWSGRSRLRRGLPLTLVGALLLPVVVGCGEDGEERSFAPAGNATGQVAIGSPGLPRIDEGTPTPAATAVATLTASQLLRPRGAPTRFYFLAGDELLTMDAGDRVTSLLRPEAGAIVAHSASPSGDAVAALLTGQGEDGDRSALVVLSADGEERRRVEDLGAVLGDGVDEPTPTTIDWSPQGNRLLVSFASGELLAVDAEGTAPPAVIGSVAGATPTAARWSPTGEDVAVLARSGPDDGRVLLLSLGPTPEAARPLVETATDRPASALSWSPDGQAVLVVDRPADGGSTVTGDLWQVEIKEQRRQLVASAGVAPAAQVSLVRPSPNGSAVAYTVTVAEAAGSRFQSLSVKELESGRPLEIVVPATTTVDDVWWTSSGLVFRAAAVDAAGGAFELYRVDEGIEPRRIFSYGGEAATPEVGASPVADGTATPEVP